MGHEGVAPGDHDIEDLGVFGVVAFRHKVRRQTGVSQLLDVLAEPKDVLDLALSKACEHVVVAAKRVRRNERIALFHLMSDRERWYGKEKRYGGRKRRKRMKRRERRER
jgi:hypothetical protein